MKIEFDDAKRDQTLQERGLDMARASERDFLGRDIDGFRRPARLRRGSFHHDRISRRSHGRRRLDSAKRRAPHNLFEESQ
jgi:hypothetical protein